LPKRSKTKGYNITLGVWSGFANTLVITKIKEGWS